MNIRELKQLIADMDEDTEIISVDSNYELRGAYTKAHARSGYFTAQVNHFIDDFDGTPYSHEVFVPSDETKGKKMLIVG